MGQQDHLVNHWLENESPKELAAFLELKKNRPPKKEWLFHFLGGRNRCPAFLASYCYFKTLAFLESVPTYIKLIPLRSFAFKDHCILENIQNIRTANLNMLNVGVWSSPKDTDGFVCVEHIDLRRIDSSIGTSSACQEIINSSCLRKTDGLDLPVELGGQHIAKTLKGLTYGEPYFLVPYENDFLKSFAAQHNVKGMGLVIVPSLGLQDKTSQKPKRGKTKSQQLSLFPA